MPALTLRTLLSDQFRILTFRAPSSAIREHPNAYLAWGLLTACAAGIGRYWDNPKASTLQHWGVGSIVYVPFLAWLLWFVCGPLAARRMRYRTVLTFVSLTSLPALLYAIPVEQLMTPDPARFANAWMLVAVAGWRVAMLAAFLHDSTVRGLRLFVGLLYPLVFIVSVLAALNLEHAAFRFMAGNYRDVEHTPHDAAYMVVLVLGELACVAFVPLTIVYLVLVSRPAARTSGAEPPSANIPR